MAQYSSYKKVTTEQIGDGFVTDNMIVLMRKELRY